MRSLSHSKKILVVAALALTGIVSAQADPWYVGASLGTPHYPDSINGIEGSGSGVGGKVYGGYQLTPNWAVEAGYADIGHIDNANGHVDTHGVYLSAVGRYEFAPKWSVLGDAGVADARFKTSLGNDSSPALKLGAGLQYDLTREVALRMEYDHYRFTNAFESKPNVGEVSFGVNVGF